MSLLSRAGIAGAALRRAMSSSAAPVRVGIIGAGRIGQVHAKAITAMHGAEVAAIADPFEKFGWPRLRPLIPSTFRIGKICFLTKPLMSAEAGKAIMCEKPISNDLATIDKCLDVVEKTNARLLIGFQRRFDANFMEVSKQVTDGVIGEVRMFQINSRDPAPPPAEYLANSGGIFLDMMSHDFDQARFCTGAEIEEVFVAGKAFEEAAQQADDLDTVIVMLKMSNGAIGTIGNSRRCAYGYDQRIEVFGSDGMLSSNNRTPHTVNISNESSVSSPLPYSFFMDRYALAYSGVMEAFVKMIREGTPPPVTGADGRAPIVAAMAANKSIKEGRPVRLAEVDITDASAQSAQA
ncbi:inositol 2-dehydrogenase [Gracilaria domingensis]|nr:inositol 2-dehydrogenase [Gracilaria domingensis]